MKFLPQFSPETGASGCACLQSGGAETYGDGLGISGEGAQVGGAGAAVMSIPIGMVDFSQCQF